MILTRSYELQKIKINVVAGAVEELNQVTYFGVLIDNQLKWQQQLDHVCKKLACASYPLFSLRAFSPISTLKTVYYALVQRWAISGPPHRFQWLEEAFRKNL